MTIGTTIWAQGESSLLASRHRASGALRFPPLPATSPLAAAHENTAIGREGRVYSFTTIHPAPKSGLPPFSLGYVDMKGPVRLFARIAGDVRIGAACQAIPDEVYGYRFEVCGNEGGVR